MSTMQRMTLIGLYNYENTFDRDLFRNLTLPEGYDKPTFVNSLLLEHGEKCVLYTNPDFFISAIGIWSGKWALELERIYDALTEEYNPIWNYDRHDEWTQTDKPDNQVTRTHLNTDTQTNNNTDTRTNDNTDTQTNNNTDTRTNDNTDTTTNRYDVVTTQNIDSTSENQISADNSSSYQPDNKNISNAGKTTVGNDGTITDAHTGTITDAHTGTITDAHTGTITDAHTGTITNAHTGTITDAEKGTRSNIDHKAHMWGNIGVTTSSQLAESETLLRAKRNLYDIATRLFANELLIGIY